MSNSDRDAADPIVRFGHWYDAARHAGIDEPAAMSVATVGPGGQPSVRMVLLRGADERGFVFYTNLGSRKASELAGNPHAALCLHWAKIERQVRVEGRAEPVSAEEADRYFAGRARESQIGAWASRQSAPLPDRAALEERFAELDRSFAGGPVPRPPFWSGFRVVPIRIEFWRGGAHRLHDRDLYLRGPSGWERSKLYP